MAMPILRQRRLLVGGLATAAFGLLTGCGATLPGALQASRTRRIGVLHPSTSASAAPSLEAFRQGLREIGYVEDRDIALELKLASGKAELLPGLAAECVRLPVDILVT